MQCPKCSSEQQETNTECIACGIIFKRYHEFQQKRAVALEKTEYTEEDSERISHITLFSQGIGKLLMTVSFVWGVYVLFQQLRHAEFPSQQD